MVSNTQQAADRAMQDQDRREADHERHGLAAYDTPAAIEKSRQPDNHDHCEMPAVKLGQGSYERAWPDRADEQNNTTNGTDSIADVQGGGGTTGSPAGPKVERPAAFRPVTEPEQAELDGVLDDFGVLTSEEAAEWNAKMAASQPPEGKGVPAAPSPLFTTWDGNTVHYGSVICPNTAPDSQWIAGECIDGTLTLQHFPHASRESRIRDSVWRCWAIAVHRASAKPEPRAPVDIAQVLLLEIDSIKHEQQRNRVRGLILELLSRCA